MQCLKKESFSTLYTLDIQHSYCEERSNLNCLPSRDRCGSQTLRECWPRLFCLIRFWSARRLDCLRNSTLRVTKEVRNDRLKTTHHHAYQSADRSFHSGFCCSINAIFLARLPPLILFSSAMALYTSFVSA